MAEVVSTAALSLYIWSVFMQFSCVSGERVGQGQLLLLIADVGKHLMKTDVCVFETVFDHA